MTSQTSPGYQKTGYTVTKYKYSGDVAESYYSYGNVSWLDWKSGGENPRWKQQIARGRQAATTFSGEQTTVRSTPFYLTQFTYPKTTPSSFQSELVTKQGQIKPPTPPSAYSISLTKANNKAKEQLVRKVRKKQTTFQGGTFLGELGRSIALIRNPAQALRKGVGNHIRTLRRRGPQVHRMSRREVLTMVRDTWLEAQLGWAPLLSEVDDGIKAIAESRVLEDKKWEQVRAYGSEEISETVNPNLNRTLGGFPKWRVAHVQRTTAEVRYIACVDIGTYSAFSPRRMGLAPTNWLPTIWELIPYSFVVDYFSNIGDIISAASLAKSSIRWIVKTSRQTATAGYYNWRPVARGESSSYAYSIGSHLPSHCSHSVRYVDRIPYYGSLVPSLEISVPGTGTQWINTAALIDARRELQKWYR